MRMSRAWKIASLLSAILLLSSSDLCMLLACAPQEAREVAGHVSSADCHEHGASKADEHPRGSDDCARPCRMSVTLTLGPQLSPPRDAGPVALLAVLPAPLTDVVSARLLIGRAPPDHGAFTPLSHLVDASGVRGPPSA